jgi:hypothetical protein
MLTLEIPVNVFILLAIVLVSAFAGLSFRKRQVSKCTLRIAELENEVINNHGEILELQKEYINLDLKYRSIKDPVIAMNKILKSESEEKLPDISLRKKLLNNINAPSASEVYQLSFNEPIAKKA